jgi:hypothetical protein
MSCMFEVVSCHLNFNKHLLSKTLVLACILALFHCMITCFKGGYIFVVVTCHIAEAIIVNTSLMIAIVSFLICGALGISLTCFDLLDIIYCLGYFIYANLETTSLNHLILALITLT